MTMTTTVVPKGHKAAEIFPLPTVCVFHPKSIDPKSIERAENWEV